MAKILHTADFHLDSAFTALPEEKARLRRQEARQLTDRRRLPPHPIHKLFTEQTSKKVKYPIDISYRRGILWSKVKERQYQTRRGTIWESQI